MKKIGFVAAIWGMLFAGLFIACGTGNEETDGQYLTGADQDQVYDQAISAQTSVNTKISKTVRPRKISGSATAKFKFSCTAGACTYKCKMDGLAWKKCKSPKTYTALAEGVHIFKVKATNSSGQSDRTPAQYSWEIIFWDQIGAGVDHTCGIRTNGTLWCWGRNDLGQLGDGTTGDKKNPTQVGALNTWTKVDGGGNHTCARKGDGTLWCWGYNSSGQLGDGTTAAYKVTPSQVFGALTTWAGVNTGAYHTCARKTNGTLWCWGDNYYGQLGDGFTADKKNPTQVGALNTWVEINAGFYHTCSRKTDNTLWCWGYNSSGQLGDGFTADKKNPTQVGALNTWAEVNGGGNHTCSRKTDNTLWCWGYNSSGQLGDGTNGNKNAPTQVGALNTWAEVDAGGNHTCSRKTEGSLWCWGDNIYGQLGDGTNANKNVPTQVGALNTWAEVNGGGSHTCSRQTDNTLWCWGDNGNGQLGNGTYTDKNTPVQLK